MSAALPDLTLPWPLLDALEGGYWLVSDAGAQHLSPGFLALFGLGEEVARLEEAEEVLEPSVFAALREAMAEARGISGEPPVLSLTLKKLARHVDVGFRRLEGGWMLAHARDVTKTRRDLHRLQQENTRIKRDLMNMGNLLNALPIPIWMRTPELALKFCNLAYLEAAELSPDLEPEAGQTPSEQMELYRQAKPLAEAAWEKSAPQRERRHFVMGGQRRWYEFAEIPAEDRSFCAGYAIDLTELEQLQEELGRHVSAQADLLESSASAMAIFGPDKRLKFYNNAYVKLWGFNEGWLATQPGYKEILEKLRDNRALPEQANFAVYRQGHMQLFTDLMEPHEEFYYLPDGRTLRVLAIPHAMGGLLFAYEDVTDRLALERSYNTLIAVQRATLDNLHEAVAVLGENGRLRLTNPAFLALWGFQPETVAESPHISDLLERTKHWYDVADWAAHKQERLVRFQQRSTGSERIERKDGKVLELITVPLPDGGLLLTYLDITDSTLLERSLRERNEALEESDKLKTEFLANVSYELRSPLTSISGFAQMLGEHYFGPLNPKQKEYVDSIHAAANQLSGLINDILDIASIESGEGYLDLKSVPVPSMLSAVEAELKPQAEAQGVNLVLEIGEQVGEILMDEPRLRHSLSTLVSSALRYVPPEGSVVLGASLRDGARKEMIISIEERRLPSHKPLVLDEQGRGGAFYRLTASGFRTSGTGLGLSMAKNYIQLHGGRVELLTLPGGTTRILCILPA